MPIILTLKEVEELIVTASPPLNFGSQMPTYRAAVRRLAKIDIPYLCSVDPWRIPFTREMLERIFEDGERCFLTQSKSEKNGWSQWKTRLRKICRMLDGTVAGAITPDWARLQAVIEAEAKSHGEDPRHYIPLTHSLKAVAIECGLEPHEITRHWLIEAASRATARRRNALCQASKQLDQMRDVLPLDLRPIEYPISPLSLQSSKKRKARTLPPRISATLESYIARQIAGPTAMGVNGLIKIGKGINKDETAREYGVAFRWYYDCLVALKFLQESDDPDISRLGNLKYLKVVIIEALADVDRVQTSSPTVFPWHPIAPISLRRYLSTVIRVLSDLVGGFANLSVSTTENDGQLFVTARDLLGLVNAKVPKGLTPKAEAFCRRIVTDEESRAILLNLHTILWAEAQGRWANFESQTSVEQCRTLNLCALAAMTAITTSFPLRRRTLVSLVLRGEDPDVFLPEGKADIILDISPLRMKAAKSFEGTIRDTKGSQPRRIVDWFISGPRKALLSHGQALPKRLARDDLLFCGIGRARYGEKLSEWTEVLGIKMTSHLFRHAIASILINNLDCSLQHVAAMLGNTVAMVERNYLFLDKVKHRQHAVALLDKARDADLPNILHVRMRGKRS